MMARCTGDCDDSSADLAWGQKPASPPGCGPSRPGRPDEASPAFARHRCPGALTGWTAGKCCDYAGAVSSLRRQGNHPQAPGPELAPRTRLKLVTYNIHRGVGIDRRYDLGRIEAVLRDERPDIIALQEIDRGVARTGMVDQAAVLAERLAVGSNFCATRPLGDGHFGMAVLSRFPAVATREYDLSYGVRREPRWCLRVDLQLSPGLLLHVFNCHLGLATFERRYQRRRMLSDAILLSEELHHPVVVMGDFNDRPLSVVHSGLREHMIDAFRATGKGRGATFGFGPLRLRLDHIYVSHGIRVLDCSVRRKGAARIASDHRPLVAEVEVAHTFLAEETG